MESKILQGALAPVARAEKDNQANGPSEAGAGPESEGAPAVPAGAEPAAPYSPAEIKGLWDRVALGQRPGPDEGVRLLGTVNALLIMVAEKQTQLGQAQTREKLVLAGLAKAFQAEGAVLQLPKAMIEGLRPGWRLALLEDPQRGLVVVKLFEPPRLIEVAKG